MGARIEVVGFEDFVDDAHGQPSLADAILKSDNSAQQFEGFDSLCWQRVALSGAKRLRCPGLRRAEALGCAIQRPEGAGARHEARTDTNRPRNNNCPSDGWRARARWSRELTS